MLWWNADAHVDMVSHQVALYDLALFLPCQFMEHLTKVFAYPSENNCLKHFQYKNNIIPAIPCRMGKTLVLSRWEFLSLGRD